MKLSNRFSNGVKNKAKTKVLVAMSGGVDSSVAAALLKKQGYEIVGVYLRLSDKRGLGRTKSDADEKSAREVAKKLGIKFKVVDARKVFKKTVVDYFLREYRAGHTPNPCAVCNPRIKFAEIIKLANKLKVDYVATGHYAKIISNSPNYLISNKIPNPKSPILKKLPASPAGRQTTNYKLQTAQDKTKDQSYFLYSLSQKQLSRIIFPLGGYKKTETREIAKKMNLPVFNRKESHDVCFISGKAEEYLRKNIKLRKGKIINKKGKILGEHQGLPLYTIGQRKGIELGGIGPYYVAEKDIAKNKLVVASGNDNSGLFKKIMLVKNINWLNKPSVFPFKAQVRIRYGHSAVCAIIKPQSTYHVARSTYHKKRINKYKVIFKEPQRAITPGQSAVFYSRDGEVLGGGVIES